MLSFNHGIKGRWWQARRTQEIMQLCGPMPHLEDPLQTSNVYYWRRNLDHGHDCSRMRNLSPFLGTTIRSSNSTTTQPEEDVNHSQVSSRSWSWDDAQIREVETTLDIIETQLDHELIGRNKVYESWNHQKEYSTQCIERRLSMRSLCAVKNLQYATVQGHKPVTFGSPLPSTNSKSNGELEFKLRIIYQSLPQTTDFQVFTMAVLS